MSKGARDSSGYARHRSVYVCITVKGSRVCKPCNALALCVSMYVLVWYKATLLMNLFYDLHDRTNKASRETYEALKGTSHGSTTIARSTGGRRDRLNNARRGHLL